MFSVWRFTVAVEIQSRAAIALFSQSVREQVKDFAFPLRQGVVKRRARFGLLIARECREDFFDVALPVGGQF
jgi:hypothetical protein